MITEETTPQGTNEIDVEAIALLIARSAIQHLPEPYMGEDSSTFQPHEWVLTAIQAAIGIGIKWGAEHPQLKAMIGQQLRDTMPQSPATDLFS